MKRLLILSGKGGTGKTTTAAAFIRFAQAKAIADCDVDELNIGDEVEVIFRKIREEGKDGVITYGYKFKLKE